MQEQYAKLKAKYPDTILLYRLGDFYETFDQDAHIAAKVLGITLTGRGKGDNRRDMAGIPFHALKNYLPKLVSAGYKVALADQLSEPKPGGLVDRGITDVITPGVVVDQELLSKNEANYLAVINLNKTRKGTESAIILYDIGTGRLRALEINNDAPALPKLLSELEKYRPKELLIGELDLESYKAYLNKSQLAALKLISTGPQTDFHTGNAFSELCEHYRLNSLKSWGIENTSLLLGALNGLRKYLEDNLRKQLSLDELKLVLPQSRVHMPWSSYKALEIFADGNGNQTNSLYSLLNQTITQQGARQLQEWLLNPTLDGGLLNWRLGSIQQLLSQEPELINKLRASLEAQPEYDRLIVKTRLARVKPWDLKAMALGIKALVNLQSDLKTKLNNQESSALANLLNFDLTDLKTLAETLDSKLLDGRNDLSQPGFINPDTDADLQAIMAEVTKGKEFLRELEQAEIARSGISSLKLRYNKIFGYYIEISKSNLAKVPENYLRKQTLVNAERFVTEELQEWEEKILFNAERRLQCEQKIYQDLITLAAGKLELLSALNQIIAELDVIFSLSLVAKFHNFSRPSFGTHVEVSGLKHPVLAAKLQEKFIANDLKFSDVQKVILLTGPNMAGKSTYIRSMAILQLMAQIGSFVPAQIAQLTIVDAIFTRVGAADNLSQNESTFMVEMSELAYILQYASADSLIILDEVGRGTATYDGVSLAWALLEHLSQKLKAKTLFATHYHELTSLEKLLANVKNYFVEAIPGKELTFTHKVLSGASSKSFGVAVAKLAGINSEITDRAASILKVLERANELKKTTSTELNYQQLGFNELTEPAEIHNTPQIDPAVEAKLEAMDELLKLDLNQTTPLELMQKFAQLQEDWVS